MDDIRLKVTTAPARFIDQLRLTIRQWGLSYATEKTYVHWALRIIRFRRKGYFRRTGSIEVGQFPGDLAEKQR